MMPSELPKRAADKDRQLREEWANLKKSSRVVGGLFKEIRDNQLHKYIRKPGSRKGYLSFEEYASEVTGGIANSTVWVFMRIHGLTEGPNALAANDVDEMPQQNAYELSKLRPEERTEEVVTRAKKTPIRKFRAEVQEIKNRRLPAEKRKPVLIEVYEKWPPQLVEMFEDTIADFSLLPVVQDGDQDLTIRHKAIYTILISARIHAQDEIEEEKTKLQDEGMTIPDEYMREVSEPNHGESEPKASSIGETLPTIE